MGVRNKVIALIGLLLFLLFWSITIVPITNSLNYPPEYAWFFGFVPLIILLIGLAKAYIEWK